MDKTEFYQSRTGQYIITTDWNPDPRLEFYQNNVGIEQNSNKTEYNRSFRKKEKGTMLYQNRIEPEQNSITQKGTEQNYQDRAAFYQNYRNMIENKKRISSEQTNSQKITDRIERNGTKRNRTEQLEQNPGTELEQNRIEYWHKKQNRIERNRMEQN